MLNRIICRSDPRRFSSTRTFKKMEFFQIFLHWYRTDFLTEIIVEFSFLSYHSLMHTRIFFSWMKKIFLNPAVFTDAATMINRTLNCKKSVENCVEFESKLTRLCRPPYLGPLQNPTVDCSPRRTLVEPYRSWTGNCRDTPTQRISSRSEN